MKSEFFSIDQEAYWLIESEHTNRAEDGISSNRIFPIRINREVVKSNTTTYRHRSIQRRYRRTNGN
jgi:hypothetical protein